MKRVFDTSCSWLWVLQAVVSIGSIIAFIIIDGKELVYALYIPLDILFSVAKTAFFWYYYYEDKKRKEEEVEKQREKRNAHERSVSPLLKSANFASVSSSSFKFSTREAFFPSKSEMWSGVVAKWYSNWMGWLAG